MNTKVALIKSYHPLILQISKIVLDHVIVTQDHDIRSNFLQEHTYPIFQKFSYQNVCHSFNRASPCGTNINKNENQMNCNKIMHYCIPDILHKCM